MQAIFAYRDGAHMRWPVEVLVDTCIRTHPEDRRRSVVFRLVGRRESDNMPVYHEVDAVTIKALPRRLRAN
jgi:hypothetical protein